MNDGTKRAAKLILVSILMILLVLLAECQHSHAACVAAELQNGGAIIITGEIRMIQPKEIIEKADKQKAKRSDIELLAEVIYHENWHTDAERLTAYYTGAVVMNRVNSDNWPDTVKDVLYQRGQYSTTKKFYTVTLPQECYDMAKDISENGTPDVPSTVIFQSRRKQGSGIWKVINGEYFCYE